MRTRVVEQRTGAIRNLIPKRGRPRNSDRPPSFETFSEIDAEVLRARKKFPMNKHLLAALTEEVGELAKALLQRSPDWRKEAIQVACLAVRLYEEGDASFRGTGWGSKP